MIRLIAEMLNMTIVWCRTGSSFAVGATGLLHLEQLGADLFYLVFS